MSVTMNVTVYSTAEIAALHDLLHSVVSMINTAFARQRVQHAMPRFQRDEELPEELGDGGYCAIIQDRGKVVATASVRKWRPQEGERVDRILRDTRPQDVPLLEQDLSYEVKMVATVQGHEYSGRGLAMRCTEAVVDRLFSENKNIPGLLLWIQTKEDENGIYWRKRGYEIVGEVEIKPKGYWNAPDEFRFSTLVKRTHRGSNRP